MKFYFLIIYLLLLVLSPASALESKSVLSQKTENEFIRNSNREVSQEKMQEIYEQIKTPYKYGLVIAPGDNNHKMDCPTVFRKDGKWFMSYFVYNGKTGSDGRGYETWLAKSDDLLHWESLGKILSFRDSAYWDTNQRGGYPGLSDMNWGGSYELKSFKGKNWMTYIGGAKAGYETTPLNIGLAFTPEKDLTKPIEWKTFEKPILSTEDKDRQYFENVTQYKSTVYEDPDRILGSRFVLFYNAGGIHPQTQVKAERIGIALSDDLKHWKRYPGNPVFTHEEGITGDAHIQKIGDLYVMFYFSAFRKDRPYKAFNTFACSYDLVHWYDWKGKDLIIPSKNYDDLFAHKSYVINWKGIVYHFYCAVDKFDQRGIAVATSKALGKSNLNYPEPETKSRRQYIRLEKGWKTWLNDDESTMQTVSIPHNWDDYYGYRQLIHGNLHGSAWYEKEFEVPADAIHKIVYLNLEGAGSYATILVNGTNLGKHPVGRTAFHVDISKYLIPGSKNLLKIRTDHPEMISDMPWICGGCSTESGFSEGSQPLGLFRPVSLEITDPVRIEPFGVHIWNNPERDTVFMETEVKNYLDRPVSIEFVSKLNNEDGIMVFRLPVNLELKAGETRIICQQSPVKDAKLWSPDRPYLYNLASVIKRDGKTTDEISTEYGIRSFEWPACLLGKKSDKQPDAEKKSLISGEINVNIKTANREFDNRLYLNDNPIFVNGTCEYEHLLGASHSFTQEQVSSRVKQIKSLGFNAFREAHQPHNLLYQKLLDENGLLFWSQFSAHVWYDTPEFRNNFKILLRRWIKERRNSPSIMLWGLQNESVLPEAFARECSDMIREMDPTAGSQRLITTCNGGEGTDWNVVQNWSGTYGGNLYNYGKELKKSDQLLNGEYGAWRVFGFHQNTLKFNQDSAWSESRANLLLESKIRQAWENRDSIIGQFQWIYNSHDNPGRKQPDNAFRLIDRTGPVNYKGLVTPWEEPTDAYYLYKANFVSADKDPMVYILSHNWKDRLHDPKRTDIEVYSNCDSVKLYNDAIDSVYLGRKIQHGRGTHFIWEQRLVTYNMLRAVGYYQGKAVVSDMIHLPELEKAPHFDLLMSNETSSVEGIEIPAESDTKCAANTNDKAKLSKKRHEISDKRSHSNENPTKNQENFKEYEYRINCGGDEYLDAAGNVWMKDDTTWSKSWASSFSDLNPYQASQRYTDDPISGTPDWNLYSRFRMGRNKLNYEFPLNTGDYEVELYFIEPWIGTGSNDLYDGEGLRIFDVALNDSVVLNDLDIYAETGHDRLLKKTVRIHHKGGKMNVSFPEVKVGEALISAIAISRAKSLKAGTSGSENGNPETQISTKNKNIGSSEPGSSSWTWESANDSVFVKLPEIRLPKDRISRNTTLLPASEAKFTGKVRKESYKGRPGMVFRSEDTGSIAWNFSTGLAQVYTLRFRYSNTSGKELKAVMELRNEKGNLIREGELTFPQTEEKWKIVNTTTGSYINAGKYTLILKFKEAENLGFESLEIQ